VEGVGERKRGALPVPASRCPGICCENNANEPSIEVKDISLTDYINVNHAVYVPHTAGRYAKKQFAKGRMPIVERLVNA